MIKANISVNLHVTKRYTDLTINMSVNIKVYEMVALFHFRRIQQESYLHLFLIVVNTTKTINCSILQSHWTTLDVGESSLSASFQSICKYCMKVCVDASVCACARDILECCNIF